MNSLYRKNVGIVVVNNQGKVLMCARADQANLNWQFPQGGLEKEETAETAALRELYEETGITSVKLLDKMPDSVRYEFPKNNKNFTFAPYIGQEQQWVFLKFTGLDSEINLCINPLAVEFKAFEWVDMTEAPKRIIAFKKHVYQKVSDYFEFCVKEKING